MKRVSMIFEKSEIVFDIKQRAYAAAKSATQKSDEPDKDDNWLIDIANKEDLTREPAGRFISLAFMEAYTACSPLSPETVGDADYVESDRYTEVSRYIMYLQVGDKVPMHRVRYLHDLIHEFIVYKTLFQWAELVSREHMEVFGTRASVVESDIKTEISGLKGDGGERPYFPQW